jgi:hypothetical protein
MLSKEQREAELGRALSDTASEAAPPPAPAGPNRRQRRRGQKLAQRAHVRRQAGLT